MQTNVLESDVALKIEMCAKRKAEYRGEFGTEVMVRSNSRCLTLNIKNRKKDGDEKYFFVILVFY